MSDDLAKFLAARLDDDEDYARTMTKVGERNAADATPDDVDAASAVMVTLAANFMAKPEVVALMDRYAEDGTLPPNNLERVLRDVAAKRAILAAYSASVRSFGEGLSVSHRRLVQALAAVYSDHPDYRQEWKP